MQCPNDGAVLVMSERSGIEIDYCPTCRGVWLDRGELDKIIDRAAQEFQQVPPAAGQPVPQQQPVPPQAAPTPYPAQQGYPQQPQQQPSQNPLDLLRQMSGGRDRDDDRRYDDRRYDDRDRGYNPGYNQGYRKKKKDNWLSELFD
jgi:Zn-finger nucleic acid-binding protein